MSGILDPSIGTWTAADLVLHFGPIPLQRIRQNPPPGTASEEDVIRIHDQEGRLYELVDGTLVEKTVGTYESYLALVIARHLANFVADRNAGIVLGADGMMRLSPGLVRIPDVSFIAWERLPNRTVPRQAIADIAPDLAVEVISPGNTPEEMQRKLQEYFANGVREVWYVYPNTREVHIYRQAAKCQVLKESQAIDGGDVLPGFSLALKSVFTEK